MTEHPDERWTLLYDGDCGFCKVIVSIVLAWDGRGRLETSAIQSAEGQALLADLAAERRLDSVHLLTPAGERLSGGPALAPLLRLLPGGRILAAAVARSPRLTSRAYEWIAAHRTQLSRPVPQAIKRRASARVREVETRERPGMI